MRRGARKKGTGREEQSRTSEVVVKKNQPQNVVTEKSKLGGQGKKAQNGKSGEKNRVKKKNSSHGKKKGEKGVKKIYKKNSEISAGGQRKGAPFEGGKKGKTLEEQAPESEKTTGRSTKRTTREK